DQRIKLVQERGRRGFAGVVVEHRHLHTVDSFVVDSGPSNGRFRTKIHDSSKDILTNQGEGMIIGALRKIAEAARTRRKRIAWRQHLFDAKAVPESSRTCV